MQCVKVREKKHGKFSSNHRHKNHHTSNITCHSYHKNTQLEKRFCDYIHTPGNNINICDIKHLSRISIFTNNCICKKLALVPKQSVTKIVLNPNKLKRNLNSMHLYKKYWIIRWYRVRTGWMWCRFMPVGNHIEIDNFAYINFSQMMDPICLNNGRMYYIYTWYFLRDKCKFPKNEVNLWPNIMRILQLLCICKYRTNERRWLRLPRDIVKIIASYSIPYVQKRL